jgi:small subunit ribosomal protein S17
MSSERRKARVGTVIQDRMDKTVVVAVEWRRPHKLYRKPVRRRSRFYAHDEANACRIGDQVRIIETRPLSKMKRWRVVEVLSSTEIAEIAPQDIDREVIEGTDLPQTANEGDDGTLGQAIIVEPDEAAPDESEADGDVDVATPEAQVAEAQTEEDTATETEAAVEEDVASETKAAVEEDVASETKAAVEEDVASETEAAVEEEAEQKREAPE